jgi:hypothetical protein
MTKGIKESEGKISYKEVYIPFKDAMAKRMMSFKGKYPEGNYLKNISKDELLDALERHLNKIRYSYEDDPESIEDHLAAIGCNAQMIYAQIIENGRDTRVPRERKAKK